ncbi:unnamed protein product, partial [Rotaria sp. Silwood1]
MHQFITSNKLVNYLHRSSSSSFLELEPASSKSPSSNTSILVQPSSSFIDYYSNNSLYQQLIESSPLSLNTSSSQQLITSLDLHMPMSPISENNYSNHSTSKKTSTLTTNDSIPNMSSSTSTSISKRKTKSIIQSKSSIDQCNSKDLSNKQHCLSTSHENINDYVANYKLCNFIIRIEQIPNLWMIDTTNERLVKDDKDNKNSLSVINKQTSTSPILHGLLTSSSKSVDTNLLSNIQSTHNDINEDRNNKSPQYRPRHSYFHSSETLCISKDNLN